MAARNLACLLTHDGASASMQIALGLESTRRYARGTVQPGTAMTVQGDGAGSLSGSEPVSPARAKVTNSIQQLPDSYLVAFRYQLRLPIS